MLLENKDLMLLKVRILWFKNNTSNKDTLNSKSKEKYLK